MKEVKMGATLKRGYNDLMTVMPNLAAQWHPVKNGKLIPAQICIKSSRSVWWRITVERFGKTFVLDWQASVANRANGTGCPYTSKPPKRLLKGFNDLSTTNPDVASLWHPIKNGSVKPDMIFEFTNQKYWWQHKVEKNHILFTHDWYAIPGTVKINSCPICHGTKVMVGFNDLVSTHPNIAAQWDEDANGILRAYDVSAGSNIHVGWICNVCGKKWRAAIHNRTSGSGCPCCAYRYSTSFPEQIIYYYLKKLFPDCTNRNKEALDGTELDVFLPKIRVAIEYNGLWAHNSKEKQKNDLRKIQACITNDILLIRVCEDPTITQYFPEQHLIRCKEYRNYTHLNFVMACISEELMIAGYLHEPIKINLACDEQDIYAQYLKTIEDSSLASKFPHLLAEWNYEENGKLSPNAVFAFGSTQVHWKHSIVKNGKEFIHKWVSAVKNRTSNGNNCPICAGKKVMIGYNDLKTAAPDFLSEWDYSKNVPLNPENVITGGNKKFWWVHTIMSNRKKHVHSWQATVSSRMRRRGCPICNGKIIQKGFNDLTTTHPQLLKEWDYNKNKREPTSTSYGYDKKVWWLHTITVEGAQYQHSWQASPNSRTNKNSGCPYCANKKALAGYNDLATIYPEIAQKWDITKNGLLTAKCVTAASGKKVWWTDRKKAIRISDRVKYIRKKDDNYK